MTRVLIYTRQSVEQDEGDRSLSIESQVGSLTERCRREGWAVVGDEREAGLRGWEDEQRRPALARCIARAEAGEYDTLLVFDLSRLARSVRLQETWIWRLARVGVDVVSHSEPHAADEMVRVIFGAIHQRQTKIIAANVRRAIYERVRSGKWHGRCCLGYRVEPGAGLVVVPEEAGVVREVAARIAAGESYPSIAADLNRRGVPSHEGAIWHPTTVRNVGTRVTYTGTAWIGDVAVEGAHEALIDPETWAKIQRRLGSRERAPRGTSHPTFLTGFLRCGCGAKCYPRAQVTRRNGREYPHVLMHCGQLRCDAPRRSVSLANAEAWVIARLAADLERAVGWRAAYDEAVRARARSMPDLAERERKLRRKVAKVEAETTRLDDEYFKHGTLDRATWLARKGPAEGERDALLAELAQSPPAPDPAQFRMAAATLKEIGRWLEMATPPTMRRVLGALEVVIVIERVGLRLAYGSVYAGLLGGGDAGLPRTGLK